MALDALFKLDPTSATSNSNFAGANIAENCAPSGINNALRALGQMVAQQICYQSAALSASVSTNIVTTSTGLFIPIVGANAINSLGTVPGEQASAAVIRFLQFSSSASLSNGTTLRLLGNASRKTQPGDIGGYVHVGSADVWHEFLWSRAADADGNFTSLSASIAAFTIATAGTLNASSASVSHVTATTISASIINVAGVQEFPRPVFLASKSAASQNSISSSQTITFDSEDIDVGGYFASNAWTPPAGNYRLSAQILWNLSTATGRAGMSLRLQKNGTVVAQSTMSMDVSVSIATHYVAAIVSANGTDAFTVAGLAGTTAIVASAGNGAGTSMFFGERI